MDRKNTYELVREAAALVCDIEAGDLDDAGLFDRFQTWIAEAGDKFGALRAVLQRLKGESALLKAEADRLTDRRRAITKAEERVKGYAAELMIAHETATGEAKIKTELYTVYLGSSEKLEGPEDVADWPAEFVALTPRPDKAKAKAALKSGQEVAGFRLVQSRSARFR